jgi:hypothetical protein
MRSTTCRGASGSPKAAIVRADPAGLTTFPSGLSSERKAAIACRASSREQSIRLIFSATAWTNLARPFQRSIIHSRSSTNNRDASSAAMAVEPLRATKASLHIVDGPFRDLGLAPISDRQFANLSSCFGDPMLGQNPVTI